MTKLQHLLAEAGSLFRDLARSRVFWTGIGLMVAYWVVAAFLPAVYLIPLLNFILIGIALAVSVSYFPSVLDAVRRDDFRQAAHLAAGILLSWIGVILNRSWAGAIRVFDEEWMRNAPIVGFYIWIGCLAGTLHITAPGALDGYVPKRNLIMLGAAIGGGFVLFTSLVVWQFGFQALRSP